ncbi:nitrate/sulfonate/bicarbonate family ABC transporter periplasmic ligand binding protein [Caballeronia novacaledonica]|uniref:Nitrate/sulfonate/bicarbonate family ABC transporter periplasmic ligand binding protein n=1 Tax=Caballeronia novacaledonica TaxID=1544861 RepID=A0A2U3I410_9BURK|nr:ABC transporter substrate-binding protein [Caballeronia novacaledonica]SPB14841.1 nitrate/sulfonate/bicarbonate family ABC transporter periplasmic ligand binding protein [Caballeronia novacaledonica]
MGATNRPISRRQLLGLTVAGAASLVVPGISHGRPQDHVTLLMGSGGPLIAWAPTFIAEALGYYKDEGLTIERIYTRSGPAGMTALVSGAGDAYYTAPGELLAATVRGQQFKIVMAQSVYQDLYFIISNDYAKKHGITAATPFERRLSTAKSFKGIRIGVSAPGSVTDYCARRVLSQINISASDASIVPLQSTENTIAAIGNGTIDALVSAPPGSSLAQSQLGGVILFSVGRDEISGFRSISGHLIEARADDVKQKPEVYRAIVRADTRGLKYIVENSKAAGDTLYKSQYSSLVKAEIWPEVWASSIPQFKTPFVSQRSLESWVAMGMVPGVGDPKAIKSGEIIDMRFATQAVQSLNWKVSA